jgi:type II secretory pathway component PulJ
MIALALGMMLVIAFVSVLGRCRSEMAINESLAQLEQAARQATDAVVLDLEHAGFYGFSGGSTWKLWRNGAIGAEADALRQSDAAQIRSPVAGLPAGAHACGANFAVDLEVAVQAANHSWLEGASRDCAPAGVAGGVHAGSDTLTVRHASRESTDPRAGRLQLYSRRRETHGAAAVFADGVVPGPRDEDAEVRDLEVRSYYIANNSVDRPGWPALRVKALTESRGAAQFRDEEVMPGVEDLQVELGVRDADGKLRFVTPDFVGLRAGHVVAVRVWLRIRADTTENGFEESRALQYSDTRFVPGALEATQRRALVQRTVFLRNSAPR